MATIPWYKASDVIYHVYYPIQIDLKSVNDMRDNAIITVEVCCHHINNIAMDWSE